MVLIVVRLAHWLRTRNRALDPARIVTELRMTLLLAAILSWAAGFWAINLVSSEAPEQQDLVILFASLGAVGAAYGLSGFPAAGRLPLLLFALPFSVALGFSPNPAHVAVGISLGLISLLSLRLLRLQDAGLVELVRSRSVVESERERALRAERAALGEQERVKRVANTDSLTGLANRRAFLAALEARLAEASEGTLGVILVDLDGFKPINDIFGHATGDALLTEVAGRMQRQVGNLSTMVARIGGDEFGLVIDGSDEACILKVARRLSEALGRPYRLEGREFRVSACCGAVKVVPGASDVTSTLRNGDIALYSAKELGRGSVALFTPELERANHRKIEIERALRNPLALRALKPVFQPIFDLSRGSLVAFEALARWQHPRLGEISPGEFIPIAEQNGLVEGLSEILLGKAAREVGRWPAPIRLSFNLSAVQVCSPKAAERILRILGKQGLEPSRVWFEVTETALLAELTTAHDNLDALRRAGARIALDDFGAGHASISYLRQIDFDAVKLDGSLITGIAASARAGQLLKGVLGLCESIGVPCVAEHIETDAQLRRLIELGCDAGQGLALSPPVDARTAAALANGLTAAWAGQPGATPIKPAATV
ncbi:MAG: putative bifunctional diguanylate cyclase/phosphodiesterase [Sphingosinicella sp.]|uniref:putative bifunctional diguanylate cyclase/phosphodiesterase n=1 Tax=Sphingosinicella sp. TaxID=1917971 RepID=UPI0040381C92